MARKSRARPRSLNPYLLPAVIYVTALTIFPTIYLIYISLLSWNIGAGPPRFIGLQNFINALFSPTFQHSFAITFGYATGVTIVELGLGLGVALLIDRRGLIASVCRNSLILPLMMTPFLIYLNWNFLLNEPIPYLALILFHIPNAEFFAQVPQVYISLLVIDIWQWLPFVIVIILAGLNAIAREPLEAAELDGAGSWAKFRFIKLPLILPVIAVVTLFRLVDSLQILAQVRTFTSGGPGQATNFMSYLIYETGLGVGDQLGLAAAYSLLFLVSVLAVASTLMYVLYRLVIGR